ncbi:MAG TPA: sensor histidine kinase [Streptosporangiaceae bacterium]|nr:sensor histidine kinase [Streptosporangiaceae bacterium]
MTADWVQVGPSGYWHAALLYASRGELVAQVAGFLASGVQAAEPVLVAAAEPDLSLLLARLGDLGGRLDGQGEQVTWADMSEVGRNPARLIDTFKMFAAKHPGRMARCVQEPAWPDRSRDELAEVIRHEALLNLAFAGTPVRVLCPYAAELGDEVTGCAERTHPVLIRDGQTRPSASYPAPGLIPGECDWPLSRPPDGAEVLSYRDQLAAVRQFTAERAARAGLPPYRVADLVLAVSELAANTLAHTGGPGSVTVWTADGEFLCQIHDAGQITDPLAGRLRTDPGSLEGGRGLWVVQQVCDLAEIRTGPAGTTIRLHMRLSTGSARR